MVVKLVNAVVTNVAVRSPEGSEDEASFTELKSTNLGRIYLLDGPEKDALGFACFAVLRWQLSSFDAPDSSRNNAGVSHGGSEEVKVRRKL